MLREDEALAVANALPPCLDLDPEDTDANVVGPLTTRLHVFKYVHNDDQSTLLRETLELWHALASCPGYGATENPSFWTRVLRNLKSSSTDRPNLDRAWFFPDPLKHPFPSVALEVSGVSQNEAGSQQESHSYDEVARYLTQLIHPSTAPRSEAFEAALSQLQCFMDPHRFSRPIPVRLVCRVPVFGRNLHQGHPFHDSRTWTVTEFIEKVHEWLVQLPQECTTMASNRPRVFSAHTATTTRPLFVVDTVSVIDLHDIRDDVIKSLQALMDDPRLAHMTFPLVGLVKIHQSTQPASARSLLNYILRPHNAPEPLALHPRLPHSLSLTLTDDGTNLPVGDDVELFFQLLPFVQAIESLTLVGMHSGRQWGWLGFALFHPAAQVSRPHSSSLKRLTITTTNYNLRLGTLHLYREALRLRTSSVDEFKAIVDGYHPLLQRPGTVWPAPPPLDDVDASMLPVTSIEHLAVTFWSLLSPIRGVTCKSTYALTPWAEFILTLAPSLRSFHVKPMENLHDRHGGRVCGSLTSDELLTVVDKCGRLAEFAVPACGWNKQQLVKLFSTTRLRAIELHATSQEIRQSLRVLNRMAPAARRHLHRLGLGVLRKALGPVDWRLCGVLLDQSPCLEYLYVHMEKLDHGDFRDQFREHPPGAVARRVKGRCGEPALTTQAQSERIAFLSVVYHSQSRNTQSCAWNFDWERLDSALVGLIFQFARPITCRFVGIDWLAGRSSRVVTCDDAFSTHEDEGQPVYRGDRVPLW